MKKILIVIFTLSLVLAADAQDTKNYLHLRQEFTSSLESSHFELSSLKQIEVKKKNTGLAIIYSLLLPGMGELYADGYQSGKYFTIAEGALWGAYIGVNTYGNWQKNRYKSFAAANGDVNIDGKDDEFFATIGEYLNVEQYNNEKLLERNFFDMLDETKYYWKWSPEDRKAYRNMWVSSEEAFNNLRFVVGALIINRIASAVNAVRLVSAYNKRQSEELSWNVYAGIENPINLPSYFTINFQTNF
jgi:hypothetical protein